MTVTEVKGFGCQKGQVELYRGAEHRGDFVPRLHMTVMTAEDLLGRIVEGIRSAAS